MLMWIPRQWLFNNSLWQKHMDAGDLADWLLNGAISASGLSGPLDMFNQMLDVDPLHHRPGTTRPKAPTWG